MIQTKVIITTNKPNVVISGAVEINQTGMKTYSPENRLAYIATHKNIRGKGIGKLIIQKTLELAKGSIALHLEPENPLVLYKRVGLSNKNIERRLMK